MALQKNVASQKWIVFAWTIATNVALAGDAAQITGNVWLDGVTNAIDDTNPTELGRGFYAFDLSQAETNASHITMDAASSTGGVAVIGCPMACWTDQGLLANVAAIPTTAMRGTDNVVLAGPTKAEMDTAHGLLATPAQVATALTDIKLDHLVAVADADDAVDSSIVAKLASKGATPDWSTFVNTTDALEAIRDRGDAAWVTGAGGSAPTAAEVADAVWDEDVSGHETALTSGRVQSAKMGEWEVIGNQLVCKGLSGTVLFTYDLTQDTNPTEYNPDKRTPV